MRDAHNKMSKRHGDPSYEDLLKLGYLSDAVLNYVALLGWSPGGEREIFRLKELVEVFDISGISKSPAIFDIAKLNHFNSEYIRSMSLEEFHAAALPYIREVVRRPEADTMAIAEILQPRCEKLTDIPEKIDFLGMLPEYDNSLYVHKKSKTDENISLEMLNAALPVLESIGDWSRENVHNALFALIEKLGIKNAVLLWPLRIALAGKGVTPGGAVEICYILGKDEALRRVRQGIKKLS